uniref:Uncharacterized protein n=1 Tax=Anguilla anguilla TaxID=7936 RepID=A0A0E9UVK8_ANGAN
MFIYPLMSHHVRNSRACHGELKSLVHIVLIVQYCIVLYCAII